jgi:F-type H+-transporting ATPase subunit a
MGVEEEAAGTVDPIHQFAINDLVDFGTVGGVPLAFTNSALFMVLSVGLIAAFLILGTSGRALVPGRVQALAEMSYEFVANMLRESAGQEGMRFFPFVFSLFMFVLFANLLGLFPYFFTVTSHIVITAALAATVILLVIGYGFYRNGLGFMKLFVPHGVPGYLLPLVVLIEVLSFLSRPISLSVRLFANMLAGHITLKVFASFIIMLGAFGFAGWIGAIIPFAMTVALTALEVLVAFLQAYVFAILTCMYLNDALHPSH